MLKQVTVLLAMFNFLVACSQSEVEETFTKSVSGNASIVIGATAEDNSLVGKRRARIPLTDGNWRLSPSEAIITFTKLDFISENFDSISATLTDCEVTYDNDLAAGTNLLDCAFSLELTSEDEGASYQGTFIGMNIYFNKTIQVKLEGSDGGIYSDPNSDTKLSATEPAGGADFVDYVVTSSSATVSRQVYFNTPYVVTDSDVPTIQIVTDMIHTIMGEVEDSVPSFQANSGQLPIELIAIPGEVSGRSEFYSTAETAETTLQEGSGAVSSPENNYLFVRVFYADNEPVAVMTNGFIPGCHDGNGPNQAYAVNPENAIAQDDQGNKAGGFLGLSDSLDISWAFGTDWLWDTYSALYVLPQVATLGGTAQLKCQAMSTVPEPVGSDTFSGATPDISTTDSANSLAVTVTLLAK